MIIGNHTFAISSVTELVLCHIISNKIVQKYPFSKHAKNHIGNMDHACWAMGIEAISATPLGLNMMIGRLEFR